MLLISTAALPYDRQPLLLSYCRQPISQRLHFPWCNADLQILLIQWGLLEQSWISGAMSMTANLWPGMFLGTENNQQRKIHMVVVANSFTSKVGCMKTLHWEWSPRCFNCHSVPGNCLKSDRLNRTKACWSTSYQTIRIDNSFLYFKGVPRLIY